MNYKILTLTLIFFSGIANAAFPINNVRVTITKLEVWPSNEGVGRYNALVSEPISGTGCANENGFSIEVGPGQNAAYSTLLAAVMANKQVELFLKRCDFFVVADRIRVIP
jgi:hypothetical protein